MIKPPVILGPIRLPRGGWALVAWFAFALAEPSPATEPAQPVAPKFTHAELDFFEARIRPVLAENCFGCHGSKKQESGLRLDSRSGVLEGGYSGAAAHAGEPGKSRLLRAVRHEGDFKMPPEGRLQPSEIAALEKWIKLGLPWPKAQVAKVPDEGARRNHWAFQPIRNPPIPEVEGRDWAKTSIDRFVLAKLEEAALEPNPPADLRTLARRLHFDLIGLPPTPEEVSAFLEEADRDREGTIRALVERLLASPHYGERWGRYWLDVARYADNKGYVFFEEKKLPWAYTYRDYVIRAFNEDKPFDRFVLEQIAADELELGEDRQALAALGFLTVGPRFMNNVHDIIDDRIDVVTRGLLGLTVTCARCHDHKYDPVPQADYYSLYGVFRSSFEPTVPPALRPPDTEEQRKFQEELENRVAKLDEFIATTRTAVIQGARDRAGEYLMAVHARRGQPSTEDFMLLTEKGGLNPYVILRWEGYLDDTREAGNPVWTAWHRFAELPDEEFARRANEVHAELFAGQSGPPVNALVREAFTSDVPDSMQEVADTYAALLGRVGEQWRQLRDSSGQGGEAKPEGFSDPAKEELRQVLYGEDSPAAIPPIFGWGFLTLLPDRPSQGEFKKLLKAVEEWLMTGPGAPPRAMVLADRPQPYEPVIFLRGNPHRPGEPVPRQFPRVLAGPDREPFTHGSGRLELAQAIVDPENPLTARVIVNRVWQHHFGQGLVRTPSDFGLRSDPPTHPRLLDHLATRFVREGWSLKALHRRIVMSAVYQQASDERPQARQIDPENRLLWRFNRRRLEFEATRDALLAVSGSLDRRVGGPPEKLLEGFVPRRTVYGFIDRMDFPLLLRSFDVPEPAATSPKRDATTVPPQALYFMNNPFLVQCAQRVAARPEISAQDETAEKVAAFYRLLFGREPREEELALAAEYFGEKPEATALTDYVHALLMSNEFVFVD